MRCHCLLPHLRVGFPCSLTYVSGFLTCVSGSFFAHLRFELVEAGRILLQSGMKIDWPSPETANLIAFELFNRAIQFSEELDIQVEKINEATVLDFAVERQGKLQSGILLSQICMGGMAMIDWLPQGKSNSGRVEVRTEKPLRSCMGSQYAGWPISEGDFFAMCSGPMRMLRGKEDVLTEYGLVGDGVNAVGVMEANALPTEEVISQIAAECRVDPRDVCLCVARTASYPGAFQVVARGLETAIHKLHELKFDLGVIVDGKSNVPIPPIPDDDLVALGWTNDCVLYGGKVELTVDTTDQAIEVVIEQVPSCSSSEFGTPFLEIFNRFDQDFYKIDKMLFSPAEVTITNQQTGNVFQAGHVREDVLKSSFGV